MLKVLFVSVRNAARSPMAEAILNLKAKDRILACSAGSEPTEALNPAAVEVMKEIGVDIGGNKPKSIEDFSDVHFDFVITLCERANTQSRNTFEDSTHTFWDIADPNCFEGTEQEKLMKLRKVRTELFTRIDRFLFLNLEKNIKKVIPV